MLLIDNPHILKAKKNATKVKNSHSVISASDMGDTL